MMVYLLENVRLYLNEKCHGEAYVLTNMDSYVIKKMIIHFNFLLKMFPLRGKCVPVECNYSCRI